ncbi:OsmC family protein [Arthrobacter sp. TMN-50]
MDRIDRVIRFDGELNDDQRQRLREIADKCPVHRTLHSEILIETIVSDTNPGRTSVRDEPGTKVME